MPIRFALNLAVIVFSSLAVSFAGCDAQPVPPAAAKPSAEEDHADHEHAHDEHADDKHADEDHAHEHGEDHADKHDHDHEHAEGEHAHPETFAAAVAEVDELRAVVEKASAADDLAKADGEVHEIGHLLEDVGKLAEKEVLDDDAKSNIKSAVEDLMDAFEQIDAKIHGDEGKTYADVADKISAAMTVLKANGKEEK